MDISSPVEVGIKSDVGSVGRSLVSHIKISLHHIHMVVLFYSVLTLFGSFNTEFNFKQFSLAEVRSLNVKTVIFKAIQFSIGTEYISI